MKRNIGFVAAAMFLSLAVFVQEAAGQVNRGVNIKSTEVLEDGKVAFRVHAPEAQTVTFSGDLAPMLFR